MGDGGMTSGMAVSVRSLRAKPAILAAGSWRPSRSKRAARVASGVHIKAVADLLGHSSIAVTRDIYGHTSDDTARAVDGLVGKLGL